jgi:hypothetical protein
MKTVEPCCRSRKGNVIQTMFILSLLMAVLWALVVWLVVREPKPKCITTNKGLTTICDGKIVEGGKK